MIAGDVRSLAREYCERGVKVLYDQYPLGHVTAAVPWIATAVPWLEARFAGAPAPQNCAGDRTRQPAHPDRRIGTYVDGPKTPDYAGVFGPST